MPVRWSNAVNKRQVTLWPFRSLPRRGFAAIILMAFTLITVPLYGLLGTVFLWGMLPFVLAAVAGLWWALEHTYKTAETLEQLTITPEETVLVHQPRKGAVKEWRCNTYWVRSELYRSEGPVANYVTLSGNGREVEIGRFLSEDERKQLFNDLNFALDEMKQGLEPDA
ncbi:DUF2244 domain-containing protein [Rhodalgimonas zhirmunskyi]|uniref:DUF2244 domain-containing protein n=1 Tax=Rhodalgimonas zhirmunskyi TaxID=2964767 RepID=A0AAJ1U6G3_9RHOB|nr:DUF2244 domain-containing protein [Rhodoalgimonas zhirmunskyi]MDQ2093920.1 DUF2244 domain-containing protein [Rhodoalgimonas zhirmunskyi]